MIDLKKLIKNALEDALKQSDPVIQLKSAVKDMIVDGYNREDIIDEFELLRKELSDETEENVVLDIMDFVVGWCSPHMKI
jgi:hypothetical protein